MIYSDVKFIYKGNTSLQFFINKNIYEPFLLNILTQIPEYKCLVLQDDQSHGQDDFIDQKNGISIEASLLINDGIFSKILKNKKYLYSEELYNQRINDVKSVFIDSLNRKFKKQTHIVFLNIFPDLFPKLQGSLTEKYFLDKTDCLIDTLIDTHKELLLNKTISLVSYNIDNSFYFRTINERKDNLIFLNNYQEDLFPFKITKNKLQYE